MITISSHTLIPVLQWIQQTPNLFTRELSPLLVDTAGQCDWILPGANAAVLQSLSETLNHKAHTRLGIYYEHLWHFLLQQSTDYSLLAHNLPVRAMKGGIKTTLGEYDLIFRHRGQVYHRELAVKFYLGVPVATSELTSSPLSQWVGPGLADRLDRKVERILNHQITLSQRDEGIGEINKLGVKVTSDEIHKEILIQGRLFYPLYGHCPAPQCSHPNHLTGLWMTVTEFRHWHARHLHSHYLIMNKSQWITISPNGEWLLPAELLAHLSGLSRPQYIYDGTQHLFIVPDDWSAQAEKTASVVAPENSFG